MLCRVRAGYVLTRRWLKVDWLTGPGVAFIYSTMSPTVWLRRDGVGDLRRWSPSSGNGIPSIGALHPICAAHREHGRRPVAAFRRVAAFGANHYLLTFHASSPLYAVRSPSDANWTPKPYIPPPVSSRPTIFVGGLQGHTALLSSARDVA